MTMRFTMNLYRSGDGTDLPYTTRAIKDVSKIVTQMYPRGINFIEVLSSHPFEYDLQWRGEEQNNAPQNFVTKYFPYGTLCSFDELYDDYAGDTQKSNLMRMAQRALGYNYLHAGGNEDEDVSEMNFVLTGDGTIHPFAANCALLIPVYPANRNGHVSQRNSQGQLWTKVSPKTLFTGFCPDVFGD